MNCWKCGQENIPGATQCINCGISQNRSEPKTEIGIGLRQLYDHYGAETLLTNSLLMINGLGDFVQDSGKFRSQLKMALDAGVGKLYLTQIQSEGKRTLSFDVKVKKVLTEDAGLADTVCKRIMESFDEMIGWSMPVIAQQSKSQPKTMIQDHAEKNAQSILQSSIKKEIDHEISHQKGEERFQKNKSRIPLSIIIVIILLVIGVLVFMIISRNSDTNKGQYPAVVPTSPQVSTPTFSPTKDAEPTSPPVPDSLVTKGSLITFGHYEQDNNLDNGKESIEWVVKNIKEDKAFIVSNYILDAKPFDENRKSNLWKDSTLRAWLNNEFMSAAFNEEEQSAILITMVDNSNNQAHYSNEKDNDTSKNTEDKIFVESYADFAWFPHFVIEKATPTKYAIANGADFSGNSGRWWFRTPSLSFGAKKTDGRYGCSGENYWYDMDADIGKEEIGVRPALWIDLDYIQ